MKTVNLFLIGLMILGPLQVRAEDSRVVANLDDVEIQKEMTHIQPGEVLMISGIVAPSQDEVETGATVQALDSDN